MVISRRRSSLKVGWLCIFLLPNHDIFNFLFSGTPLVIWKQALSIILLGFALHWAIRSSRSDAADTLKKSLIMFSLLISMFYFVYSIALGLSAERVVYGLMSYIGLLGFIYFSSLVSDEEERFQLYRVIAALSMISSAGLFLDYFTDIFFFLPRSSGITTDYLDLHGITNRAAFLFGASTTVIQFQAFGLMASALLCLRRPTGLRFAFFVFVAILNLSSAYLTGSRSAFFVLLVFFIFMFFIATSGHIGVIYRIIAAFCVAIAVILGLDFREISIFAENWDRFEAALSATDDGNSHRFQRWREGFSLLFTISIEWFFGNGVGSTLDIFSDGFPASTHFESSIFQAFFEGGFGLVLLRYLFSLVAIFVFLTHSKQRTSEQWALVIFLLVHLVSTAVAPTSGAFHTQMVYFLASGLLISLSFFKDLVDARNFAG